MIVPHPYRNVICPWQTPREIRLAVKFCDRLWATLSPGERDEVFGSNRPRRWTGWEIASVQPIPLRTGELFTVEWRKP